MGFLVSKQKPAPEPEVQQDPEPAPEPEHLNLIPDGRDLGPENESPPAFIRSPVSL